MARLMGELMLSPCSSQPLSAAAQLLLPLLPGKKKGLLTFLSSVESEPGWSGVSPSSPNTGRGTRPPWTRGWSQTVLSQCSRVTQQFLYKTLALEHICFLQRAEGSGVQAHVPGCDAELMNTGGSEFWCSRTSLKLECSRPRWF